MLTGLLSSINLGQRLAPHTPFFYGWVILFTAGSTQVVRNATASLTIAVFIFPLSEELGWSRTLIAGAASFGGLAASGVSPLVGWLVDRYGARLILASSIFILGLSTVSLAWATVPVAFYLAYGVGRVIFSSPIQIGSSVLVSHWFVRMRGRSSGILFSSHSVGLVLFPLIASVVIGVSGWRDAWLVLGVLVWAIALVPTMLLIVQQPEDVGLRPDGDAPAGIAGSGETGVASFGPASTPTQEEPVWTLREAMRTPALWMFAAATGMTFLVQAGVNTHLAAYLRDQGLTAAFAGFGISMNAAVMGVGSIFWGWITERIPARYVMAGVAFTVGGALRAVHFCRLDSRDLAVCSALRVWGGRTAVSSPGCLRRLLRSPFPGGHPRGYGATDDFRSGHWHSVGGPSIRYHRKLQSCLRSLCGYGRTGDGAGAVRPPASTAGNG